MITQKYSNNIMMSLFMLILFIIDILSVEAKNSVLTSNSMENMKVEYLQLTQMLENFEGTKNFDDLKEISEKIQTFVNENNKELKELGELKILRSLKVNLLCLLLNQIDKNIDREFKFEDVPQLNVAPPPSEILLDSGISPDTIKDPQIRHKYEEVLRQNNEKIVRYNAQVKLHRMDKNLSPKFIDFIKNNYSNIPEDFNEINNFIEQYISNETRKDWIKKELKIR